jgi:hypothetical protein
MLNLLLLLRGAALYEQGGAPGASAAEVVGAVVLGTN